MVLFKIIDFFCGVVLRFVVDWVYYNQEYMVNIFNYLEIDFIVYCRSSLIYFVGGLSKLFFMVYGVEDDNVQFQDIVWFNQCLIELCKKDFQFVIYFVEGYSFVDIDLWLDEYFRIYQLFYSELF